MAIPDYQTVMLPLLRFLGDDRLIDSATRGFIRTTERGPKRAEAESEAN